MKVQNRIIDLYKQAYYSLYHDVISAISLLQSNNGDMASLLLESALKNTEISISNCVLENSKTSKKSHDEKT